MLKVIIVKEGKSDNPLLLKDLIEVYSHLIFELTNEMSNAMFFTSGSEELNEMIELIKSEGYIAEVIDYKRPERKFLY